ncbi:hypothetical protein CCACVL1_09227 [Corchorus capsularis]|uniref:Uncharacterized protein n=1 Tax=Corchorus capsularis TaxID=210143 RepID=A0A1R3IX44_COCAP|nr:hypothetical protein CCACVL1_09227 [Corchorus capsularis]
MAPLPLTANDQLKLRRGFAWRCVTTDMLPRDDVQFEGFMGKRCNVTLKWLTESPRTLVLQGTELSLFFANECFQPDEDLHITYGGNRIFSISRTYDGEGLLLDDRELRCKRRRRLAPTPPPHQRQEVGVDRITPPPSPPQQMSEVVELSSDDSPPGFDHSGSNDDYPFAFVEADASLCIIKLMPSMVMVSRSLMDGVTLSTQLDFKLGIGFGSGGSKEGSW